MMTAVICTPMLLILPLGIIGSFDEGIVIEKHVVPEGVYEFSSRYGPRASWQPKRYSVEMESGQTHFVDRKTYEALEVGKKAMIDW